MSPAAWMPLSLGDILTRRIEPVEVHPGTSYPVAGVYSFGRGLLTRDPVPGAEIAAKHLYRIRGDQIIYSKLTAFEGAFACVPHEADGWFVSNEFPVFDVDREQALPAFVALVLGRPGCWEELVYSIPGGGSRRERFQPEDFLEYPIDLPPLDEQQRIVDLVRVIDEALQTRVRETDALVELGQAVREDAFADAPDVRGLDEVIVGFSSGSSPRCEDRPPAPTEYGVLKVSAIRPGRFNPGETKALGSPTKAHLRATVHAGDVLVNRASGTRELVGSFCRVMEVRPRTLLCDLIWRVGLAEDVDPDFLIEVMACAAVREQMDVIVSGTTGAGKVSQERLLTLEVPWFPSASTQRQVAQRIATVRVAADSVRTEIDELRALRSAVVEECITGARTGPDASTGLVAESRN